MISLAQRGKNRSKLSIYRHLQDHAIPKDEHNGRVVKDDLACQTCIPKGSIMTPTTRDMTVRETYIQSIVLSNKVILVC